MNEENNNLNGVVLGSVSNEPVEPVNSGNVVMPENNGTNPGAGVLPTAEAVANPSEVVVEPTVVEPSMPNNTVVMPTENNISETPVVQNPEPTQVVNNSVAPTPEPEYTNINSIKPNTMPGFEGNIGTNPPISLENDKEPKKKGNKTVFVLVVIVLLLAVALGTYYVLNYTDLLTKRQSITITTNNLTYNVGEELSNNIDDYATIKGTNSSNCTLNTNNVDITKEGIYKYTITCSNSTKEGTITVVDNRELVIDTKVAYYVKGDTPKASDFVKDADDDVTYSFVDEESVTTLLSGDAGTYTVKIKGVTSSGKEATASAKLVITQYKVKGFLLCSAKEQTLDNSVMNRTLKLAIVEDGNNGFGNIAYDTYTFKYNKEEDFKKLKEDNSDKDTITINEITGVPVYDNTELKVTITNELDSTVLYGTYGADNLKDYVKMRTYFTQTQNYTCSYEKVNA